jgi:hypothetical protein
MKLNAHDINKSNANVTTSPHNTSSVVAGATNHHLNRRRSYKHLSPNSTTTTSTSYCSELKRTTTNRNCRHRAESDTTPSPQRRQRTTTFQQKPKVNHHVFAGKPAANHHLQLWRGEQTEKVRGEGQKPVMRSSISAKTRRQTHPTHQQTFPRARQPNPPTFYNRDVDRQDLEKRRCGGPPSLVAPPTTWNYIVNLRFGLKGGGGG